jgi:hypothetical protein
MSLTTALKSGLWPVVTLGDLSKIRAKIGEIAEIAPRRGIPVLDRRGRILLEAYTPLI